MFQKRHCHTLTHLVFQSLWQANVVHLDEDVNWKVYSSTTVAVTAFVFLCWWIYMHVSRKPLHRYDGAYIAPGGPMV